MIDKMIHADEFRLRVLLSNQCSKRCAFCLNDFQAGKPVEHANPMDVTDCIRAYGQFMDSIGKTSIVTFSGGEPGEYPFLDMVLAVAHAYCDVIKVATNGTAFKAHLLPFVSRWNIHATDTNISKWILQYTRRITIQIVVTDDMLDERLEKMVAFYHERRILVKLFSDFFTKDRKKLESRIQRIYDKYNGDGICTRFTGKQINRGPGCDGCDRDCVTLKALWYFPDGKSSICPQRVQPDYDHDSWDETMEVAHAAHRRIENE